MQKHLVSLFLLFFCFFAICQQKNVDSVALLSQKLKTSDLTPTDQYTTMVSLGILTIKQQRYEAALEHLLHAQQLDNRYKFKVKKHLRPLADLFFQFEAYEMSIFYEKKILKSSDKFEQYNAAYSLGINYLTIQDFERSYYYHQLQLQIARKLGDSLAVAGALRSIGLYYVVREDFKKADYFLKEALKHCEVAPSSPFFKETKIDIIRAFKIDIGYNYFELGKLEDAKRLLEKCIPENEYRVFDKNRGTLLRTYLCLGELDKASNYIIWIEKQCDLSNILDQLRLTEYKVQLTLLRKDYSQLNRLNDLRWKLFRKYFRQTLTQKNKVSQTLTYFLTEQANAMMKQELEHQKILKVRLDLEKKQKNWITIGSIILFILIGSCIYILLQVYKVRQRNIKLEKTQLELDNLQKELTIKSQEENLIEFALDFDRNKQFDEQIAKKLTALIELPTETITRELKTFIAEFKQLTTINQKAEVFVANSAEFLAKFKYALLKVHPNLKKSEIQLCQYVRLELSNKEIASIKNISIESVKNAKNRLKHKLGLSREESLNTYLVQLFMLRENESVGA